MRQVLVQVPLHTPVQREGVSRGEAEELLARHDRKRKTYHNHYCKIKWGDSRGYDVSINSSRLGLDGKADMMEEYIKMRLSL